MAGETVVVGGERGKEETDRLIAEALSLLKVGIANPIVSCVGMFLLVNALNQIKIGKTYTKQYVLVPSSGGAPVTWYQELLSTFITGNAITTLNVIIQQLTGGASSDVLPTGFVNQLAPPDGHDDKGDYWNVPLLGQADALNLKVALLAALVASAVSGGASALSTLITDAVSLVKAVK